MLISTQNTPVKKPPQQHKHHIIANAAMCNRPVVYYKSCGHKYKNGEFTFCKNAYYHAIGPNDPCAYIQDVNSDVRDMRDHSICETCLRRLREAVYQLFELTGLWRNEEERAEEERAEDE